MPAVATPVSTGPLPRGVPTSPVSIRAFTSVAAIEASKNDDGNDALRLRTLATGMPAEKQQQQQQLQPVSSSCARKRGGGIRTTGLQLLRPTQAYVVGEPVTLKVREYTRTGLICPPDPTLTTKALSHLQVEIRNAQPRPLLSGATLTVLDNGYFAEASLELPEVRMEMCVMDGRGRGKWQMAKR